MNEFLLVSWLCHFRNAVSRSISCSMFACGYSGVRVATFFEKLAHFPALVVKVGVVTILIHQRPQRCSWNFSCFQFLGREQNHFHHGHNIDLYTLISPTMKASKLLNTFWINVLSKNRARSLTSFSWTGYHSQLFFIWPQLLLVHELNHILVPCWGTVFYPDSF